MCCLSVGHCSQEEAEHIDHEMQEEEEDDEEVGLAHHPIALLEEVAGISAGDVKKLAAAGYNTVEAVSK